jgi:ABC-type branched-subunit amino acid transport system permease subunit
MNEILAFAILGLGAGAVYGVGAQALVLVHRATGVINFGQGALMMYAIYTYIDLRDAGRLVPPVPGLPVLEMGGPVSFWPALALSLLMAAVIALALYLAVFRPLRSAPPLSRIVAAIGVLIVLNGLAVVRFGWPGKEARAVEPILPNEPLSVLGVAMPRDRLIFAAILIAVTVVLAVVFRRTLFGLASRAAAVNEKGALLRGLSPETLAAANWVLAAVLIAGLGILVSPMMSTAPEYLTFTVVPALTAALVARFSSFQIAAATGLALGAAQSVVLKFQSELSFLPRSGLQEGLPLLVLIVAVPLLGHAILRREFLPLRELAEAPCPRRVTRGAALGLAAGASGLLTFGSDLRLGLIVSMVAAVICLSFVVTTGFVGQVSLAQVALAGVAAYALAHLSTGLGVAFPWAPLLATLVAMGLGVVVGLPALRVRGTSLAVITLACAAAIEQFAFKEDDITGGLAGIQVPAPELFGLDLGIEGTAPDTFPRPIFGLFVLVVLCGVAVAVANLRRSRTGQRFLAVRSNERAAAGLGIDVARTKLLAFAIGSLVAGLGGTLLAYQQINLSASSFGIAVALSYLAVAYVGGITSVSGALAGGALAVGGIMYTLLNRWFDFGAYAVLVSGVLLLATVVLNPEGVASVLRRLPTLIRTVPAMRRAAASR